MDRRESEYRRSLNNAKPRPFLPDSSSRYAAESTPAASKTRSKITTSDAPKKNVPVGTYKVPTDSEDVEKDTTIQELCNALLENAKLRGKNSLDKLLKSTP